MNVLRTLMSAACLAGTLFAVGPALAETPAAAPQGEAMIASMDVTATVTKIDHSTREVTLRTDDGRDLSFVASDDVKNLPQVKVGDVVKATYAEALAYEVKKGGTTVEPTAAVVAESAEQGAKPAGAIARQVAVTVKITAIDASVPSVTFTGPGGNSRTIKVRHPERLQGVSVGDTVEITYTEAFALKVEAADTARN